MQRAIRALAATCAAAALIGAAQTAPAVAGPNGGQASGATTPEPVPGEPPPPPGIAFAPVHAAQALPGALTAQARANAALDQARGEEARASQALSDAEATQAAAAANLAALKGREYEAAVRLLAAKERLRTLAVDEYVAGGTGPEEIGLLLESGNVGELGRRAQLVGVLTSTLKAAEDSYRADEQAAEGAAAPAARSLDAAQSAVERAQSHATEAAAVLAAAQSSADQAAATAQLTELAAPAPGSDIPRVVLQAYQHAADTFAFVSPSCHISWADLAALGRIESGHAQHAGTRLAANGDTYPPILGPPLDGTGGNAAIAQTPTTYYDGPGPWARAVGPMQFIPTSWASVAMVGGTDATPDPNNVFDAAMSAAAYLCRAAGSQPMDTLAGLQAAYYSYNHSAAYVAEATSNAIGYGAPLSPLA